MTAKAVRSLATAFCLAALAMAPAVADDYTSPEFDAAVRRVMEENPDVILRAINSFVAQQQELEAIEKDSKVLAVAGQLLDGENLPALGNPDGAIKLVYVLDAACTYCRQMTGVVAALISANPDIRVSQRWVPFLSPSSAYAARVAEIVSRYYPDEYADFYRAVMSTTERLTNDLIDGLIAQILGADEAILVKQRIIDDGETGPLAQAIKDNYDIAVLAGIEGTPFFFVGGIGRGGIVRGAAPLESLQRIVDRAREGQ